MKVIHKQVLGAGGAMLNLPVGYKVLSVGVQQNEPVVWFEDDTELLAGQRRQHRVLCAPTGGELPNGEFIGTVQIDRGMNLVLHVYVEKPRTVGTIYDRKVLVDVIIHHQRENISGCMCGWSVLGASHGEHVADVYEQAVNDKRGARG